MAEIRKIELKAPVRLKPHDLAHGIQERRLAVRREPHDFVLVAIMRKAQILRERLIEDAKRMRKKHASIDGDVGAPADPPGSAGEIAEAIDRDNDRLIEWRNVKGRGQMREMMFDPMHLAMKSLAREGSLPTDSGYSHARVGS